MSAGSAASVAPPRPARDHRRTGRTALAVAAALAVAVLAAGLLTGDGGREPPPPRDRPAGAPFAGTKVERWPAGAAGIVAPRAQAVGKFRAPQVRDAYALSVRYLRAAMTDPRVLYEGRLSPVRGTLRADFPERAEPVALANRFRSDVAPASREIRVNGVLAARAAGAALEVTFRYVAVYPLRPAGGGPTELVVVRRTGTLWFEAAGQDGVTTPWLRRSQYLSSHARCGAGWPDQQTYVEVWLGPPPTASPSPSAHPRVDLLDPRAPAPAGCFDDTSRL